jgi:hypothetical protein
LSSALGVLNHIDGTRAGDPGDERRPGTRHDPQHPRNRCDDRLRHFDAAHVAAREDKCANARCNQRFTLDRPFPNQFVFGKDDPPLTSCTREPFFVWRVLGEDGIVRDGSDTRSQ